MRVTDSTARDLRNTLLLGDHDLEGFGSLGEWFSSVGKSITDSLAIILNTKTYSVLSRPESTRDAMAILLKLDKRDVAKFGVFTLKGLEAHQQEYAEQISDNLTALLDLEARVYDPLIHYLATMTSKPERAGELWVDKNLAPKDHTKARKKTSEMFFRKQMIEGDADVRSFEFAYGPIKGFKQTEDFLSKATITAELFSLDNIKTKEARISEFSQLFATMIEDGELEVNKVVIKQMLAQFRMAANETSWLVYNLYHLGLAVAALNDNIEKIKTDLT